MRPQSSGAYSADKSERLEARLSQAQKKRIQYAADLQGVSLTDLVLSATQDAASKIIREHEIVTLTIEESEHFAHTLLNLSEPNSALQEAAKKYREFTRKK